MTADRLAGASRSDPDVDEPLSVHAVLGLCDELLGEVGRRRHIFAWLRAPDASAEEWLPVDGYYPGRRLVVVCREQPEDAFAALVPAHGLRLLQVAPAELGSDRAEAKLALERMILDLVPPRVDPVVREPQPRPPAGPSGPPLLLRLLEPRKAPAGAYTAAAQRSARAVAKRRAAARRIEREREHGVAYRATSQLHLGVVVALIAGVVLGVVVVAVLLHM